MTEPIISLRNVSKIFPGGVTAVDNVSFDIAQNEFFALLGPSGCGKTTLLRMISGLETPTGGEIVIAGVDMALIPPNKRPDQHGVPVLCRLPAHDGGTECRLWPESHRRCRR